MLKRSAAVLALGVATSAGGANNDSPPPPAHAPELVDMEFVEVPIIDGDRIEGQLRVHLVLNAGSVPAAERVTGALPRLRAATLLTMVEFARLHASPYRAVNSEKLSRTLTEALQREEPAVGEVLIVEVGAKRV